MEYKLLTSTACQALDLQSTGEKENVTSDIEKGKQALNKEVHALGQSYTKESELGYSPTDKEYESAISTTLWSLDEDGELHDQVEVSPYFFDNN